MKTSPESRNRRAVEESERQRIQDLCSRKCITGQNTVKRIKSSFEGMEGTAVTESERKRISDLCSIEI